MSIKSDVFQTAWWVKQLVVNPPLVWHSQDGETDEIDKVTRRFVWRVLRPAWLYRVFVKKLTCGCSRRFGRMVFYRWGCEIHFPRSTDG